MSCKLEFNVKFIKLTSCSAQRQQVNSTQAVSSSNRLESTLPLRLGETGEGGEGVADSLLDFSFFFYIGVQLIYNVVLVSAVQQSDSVIHIHISILFQIPFPFSLLQSTEQSSLCSTVGPCWLSVLHIVCVLIPGFCFIPPHRFPLR